MNDAFDGAASAPEFAVADGSLDLAPVAPLRMVAPITIADSPSLESVCAAILFAVDRPVTIEQIQLAAPGRSAQEVRDALEQVATSLRDLGLELRDIGGGRQIQTDPAFHVYVERFLVGKRRARLSRAALESLSAITYRQPITRGELEELRGVDCGQVLHTLLERNLITVVGRSAQLGKPLLYGTTEEFLAYFGLASLADLPSLEEFRSLQGDDVWEDPEVREALAEHGFLEEEAAEPVEAPASNQPISNQTESERTAGEDRWLLGNEENGSATPPV